MSAYDARSPAEHDILAVLPGRVDDLARLRLLTRAAQPPTVTVVGKYNHGKSRLLNELLGSDAFAVSDRRETTVLAEQVVDGVRWLDAPGLDADVDSEDDRHALQAAWLESDVRLFVHAAKEGELDAAERSLLDTLGADGERTHRQTLLVLSQVDQLADAASAEQVASAIGAQAPHMPLHAVSSTRHRQGVKGGKALLVEHSGLPALRASLQTVLARVPQARTHEAALLRGEIGAELAQRRAEGEERLGALRREQATQRLAFDAGLNAVLDKVGGDMRAYLETPSEGQALVPDGAGDAYRITAGKVERSRNQIAYSRACIEIDAFLAGHGVIGLPADRHTPARSLNTVMVAVMGVSVKHREHLRRIFCEPAGRERLLREFTQYYEQSDDRAALARRIAEAQTEVAGARRALAALRTLGAPA
ncbi:GTPase [Verticiella sediminum]|uniref:GTPase n=1 Tax=Verticiella sediminum TaxID=1247510 RepID=UPI00336FC716